MWNFKNAGSKIIQEPKSMHEDGSPEYSFTTPKKYKRDVTGINNTDKCVVYRTVH